MSGQRAHIVRTDAVVLRGVDYGETSRIVTLFTRSHGRMGVMARGARSRNSRFGSTLQPMSYVQAVVHIKPVRDLQTVSEVAHVRRFPRLSDDLLRIRVGLRIVEMISALTHESQENAELLNLVIECLVAVDEADERADNVWPYFALRLAGLLGFSPVFRRDRVEAIGEEGGWLALNTGQIEMAKQPGSAALHASRAGLRAFAVCARAQLQTVLRMNLGPLTAAELNALVDQYLRYHVEESFPDRASRVFAQLSG